MFILCADKNQLVIRNKEPLTSGSVNVYSVRFEFSHDWDNLKRKAVFMAGGDAVTVPLDENDECVIPWDVLASPNRQLTAGVFGSLDGEVILPSVWVSLGMISPGVSVSHDAAPTPSTLVQELAKKGDSLAFDGLNLTLNSGNTPRSTVQIPLGCTDHQALSNRDAAQQHPIESITGLKEALRKTLTSENTLSVSDILKILEV